MGDRNDALVLVEIQQFSGPVDILRRDVSVSHLENRTGVKADEVDVVEREREAAGAEDFVEVGATGLGPGGLVVAAGDEVRHTQALEFRLAELHAVAVAGLGEVTGDEHKVDAVVEADFVDRAFQVLEG